MNAAVLNQRCQVRWSPGRLPFWPATWSGPRVDAGARGIDIGGDGSGEAALERHDGGKLPAVQQEPRGAVRVAEERHVVEHRLHEPLRHVEARDGALRAQVVDILRRADEVAAAHLPADIGGPRDGLGPRVGRQERQPLRHAALAP